MPLPLTGPSTPTQESKPAEVKPHDLKPLAQASKESAKLHAHAVADHGKVEHVVVHNQVNKVQANEIINGLESSIPVAAHKSKCEYRFEKCVTKLVLSADSLNLFFFFQDVHPSSEKHVEVHAAAERSEHGEVSHAQSHMTKDHDSAMITGVAESGIPVVNHKPQSECFYLELL